jgi:hypothetical protein
MSAFDPKRTFGNFAIFAAIRRASSFVSSLGCTPAYVEIRVTLAVVIAALVVSEMKRGAP